MCSIPMERPRAKPDVPNHLGFRAEVTISPLDDEARAEFADVERWPLAQIVEVLDERTCPLCEYVDGMILDRRSPEFARWRDPSHINCRRTIAYVSAREREIGPDGEDIPTQPDFVEPPAELLRKYGHFLIEPDRHAALRVPAQPEGRDFVVRWVPAGTGVRMMTICWRCKPYELPGLDPLILKIEPGSWDGSIGPEWKPGDSLDVIRMD